MASENDTILRQCFANYFVLPPLAKDLPFPIKTYIRHGTFLSENRARQTGHIP